MTYAEIGRLAARMRAIPLSEVLSLLGAVPDRRDKAKWKTATGTISVTGTRFFDWRRHTGGGGAIDLVMHLRQVDFKTAVFWLRDAALSTAPSSGHVPVLSPPFQPPLANERNLPQVIRYLEQERRLPGSVLAPLVRQGSLYADARANAVFLLRDRDGRPVGAELRGTTRILWRGMATGSRKAAGCFAIGPDHPEIVILCESAIDALSACALRPASRCISTAGATSHTAWLPALLATGLPIACGFDTDEAGESAARAMIARHPAIQRLRPQLHDWNDDLRARHTDS